MFNVHMLEYVHNLAPEWSIEGGILSSGMGACGGRGWWMWRSGLVVIMLLLLQMSSSNAEIVISNEGEVAAMSRGDGLSVGFYNSTCPRAEEIVRRSLRRAFRRDPSAPASLLRLAFHDCQVQGCDASILLDSVPSRGLKGEREASSNFGIRRLEIIDALKRALEAACPDTVSCADIVAMAGRDAVALTGGPAIAIPLGRRDGTRASAAAAAAQLPPASSSVAHTLAVFSRFGMSLPESVAILGAHTVGVGHCVNVADRIRPTRDPALSPGLYWQLRAICPTAAAPIVLPNDATYFRFDNRYFKDVLSGRGLFAADAHLVGDARTKAVVSQFAGDERLFFRTFASAFRKMVGARAVTGNAGEVRSHCRRVN